MLRIERRRAPYNSKSRREILRTEGRRESTSLPQVSPLVASSEIPQPSFVSEAGRQGPNIARLITGRGLSGKNTGLPSSMEPKLNQAQHAAGKKTEQRLNTRVWGREGGPIWATNVASFSIVQQPQCSTANASKGGRYFYMNKHAALQRIQVKFSYRKMITVYNLHETLNL